MKPSYSTELRRVFSSPKVTCMITSILAALENELAKFRRIVRTERLALLFILLNRSSCVTQILMTGNEHMKCLETAAFTQMWRMRAAGFLKLVLSTLGVLRHSDSEPSFSDT